MGAFAYMQLLPAKVFNSQVSELTIYIAYLCPMPMICVNFESES